MPTETAQTPASQTRTCPQCGLSGFASLQGLSVHMRRVHSAAVTPRPPERAEANDRGVSTPPARAERENSPENSPAVKEIHCPACESKVSSDGITVLKKSPNLIAFEEAEIDYSNLEADFLQLSNETWLLLHAEQHRLERELKAVKKANAESEGPKANVKRLRAENEKLAKQIQELGEDPVTQTRKGILFAKKRKTDLAVVEEHGRKLAEQLKEIQAQAREPERAGGSRNRTNEKTKIRTARG
ncbi:MAG TPA: hypothetical protein VMV59_00845 [Candidatus Dormibacteraeota bacterium]|nr:hypothetical protein [Candidatus Dormibacteraeota bacterium]